MPRIPVLPHIRGPLAWALGLAARGSARPIGVALVYHELVEGSHLPAGEVVPALGVRELDGHLRLLRRRYRVVPAADLPTAIRARRRGGRIPVAVTFDDDLPSQLALAAPLLRAHGVPATFFLTGADGRPFWWQSLQAAVDHDVALEPLGLPADRPAAAITALPGERRDAVAEALERALPPDPARRTLTLAQIRELAALGFTIGFHTRRHDTLTALSEPELRVAMRDGREALEAAAGAPLTLIAYPHGAADAGVGDAAGEAGFRLGFTTRSAAVAATDDPLRLPRPEILLTPARFALRLGVLTHPFGRLGDYVLARRARRAIRTS